jgi:hypothetical protein
MSKKAIVLRINCYRDYDFVEEHNNVLVNGKAWVLKIGKVIPEKRLQSLKDENGYIVFRTDKKHGSRFYIAKFVDYYIGEPTVDMKYPNYYREMISKLSYSMDVSDTGSWLQIERINKMKIPQVDSLVMDNSNEKVFKLLERCSSSFVYAHFVEEDMI